MRLRIDLSERRHDLRHDVPVPFASDRFTGYAPERTSEAEPGTDLGAVVKARAVQCALSRVCGMCGMSMSWGNTFVASTEEADDNTFHFPPMHPDCAEFALETYPRLGVPVLGQDRVLAEWAVVVTGGFEIERPVSRHGDTRIKFHANAVTERREVVTG